MSILGISGLAHDCSAALLSENGIVAAMEESKLVRTRATTGIPREAIRYCLERAGTGWSDVEWVAVASRPKSAAPNERSDDLQAAELDPENETVD